MKTDTITLAGIQFRGHHGDSEAERSVGGRFEVDLEITYDTRRAAESDALRDTVDYFAVHKRVLEIGEKERCQLLERLAGRIAGAILVEFGVTELTVRVRKMMPPLEGIVAFTGVEITRSREKSAT